MPQEGPESQSERSMVACYNQQPWCRNPLILQPSIVSQVLMFSKPPTRQTLFLVLQLLVSR